ncbi:recombinase family protein [Rhodococcus sp. P1Y]|uniref:recombinase family protein n=1 Tax=Rhodococcus sp. P1Y TaxID=1302308 RepID=UPI002E265B39
MSTAEQSVGAQRDALSAAGCSRVWVETASGATTSRPELSHLFSHLRRGETLVVRRLDRLGAVPPPSTADCRGYRSRRYRVSDVVGVGRHNDVGRQADLR